MKTFTYELSLTNESSCFGPSSVRLILYQVAQTACQGIRVRKNFIKNQDDMSKTIQGKFDAVTNVTMNRGMS
jgi:hypothetical protein